MTLFLGSLVAVGRLAGGPVPPARRATSGSSSSGSPPRPRTPVSPCRPPFVALVRQPGSSQRWPSPRSPPCPSPPAWRSCATGCTTSTSSSTAPSSTPPSRRCWPRPTASTTAAARDARSARGSGWVTAAATLVVAVAFRPLRDRVQDVVDRRFHRARYQAVRRMADFLEALRAGRAAPEEVKACCAS